MTTRVAQPRTGQSLFVVLALCLGPACHAQSTQGSCLPGERGYLRASLRGGIEAELGWRGASIQCEGGTRPDGRGIRVSFLGPADATGRRLRLVFGIAAAPGIPRSASAATNVTVIVQGQGRIYTTGGDEHCAVDAMVQEPLPFTTPPDTGHMYRVAARGYCIDPASSLNDSGRLYINRFDFAGVARFEDNELHAHAQD